MLAEPLPREPDPTEWAARLASSHGAPLRPGAGRLTVAHVDGASAVVGCCATPPLHLFTPCARGRSVSTLVATYGGGLLAGDVVDLSVEVGPGAIATIGTQAETKVYRSERGWAEQRMTASIDDGAVLGVVPDPTSCFAGARYAQRQRFDLHARASLLLVDSFTPGRAARGERWAFQAFASRNDVHVAGRLVLRDAVWLEGGAGPPVARRMHDFELLATFVLVGPAFVPAARELLGDVAARAADGREELLVGAGPLADGAYLRLASRTVMAGLAFVRERVARVAHVFGRDPLDRRP